MQHQEQSGELLIDRPVQTSPTENNIMSKQHSKYNAQNASVPAADEETQVFGGKAETSFRAAQSPAVSNLQEMVPQSWRIHSPHMQTRSHYP